MEEVSVDIGPGRILIEIPTVGGDPEYIQGRVKDIVRILQGLIAADRSWQHLSDDERRARHFGRLALDLKLQISLAAGANLASTLLSIVQGTEVAADYGFPEIGEGIIVDV